MIFLNDYDIDIALDQFDQDPILGPAARTLGNLRDWTNANSDGWPYWPKPCRAAQQLQTLIQRAQRNERAVRFGSDGLVVSAADVRKAYVPIKAFLTRQVRAGLYVSPGIIEELS